MGHMKKTMCVSLYNAGIVEHIIKFCTHIIICSCIVSMYLYARMYIYKHHKIVVCMHIIHSRACSYLFSLRILLTVLCDTS